MTKTKVKLTEREKELRFQLNRLTETNNGLLKKLQESEARLNERAKSAGAMRAMLLRERYEALLVKQERDALRKVIIVLAETGRFPEPSQPVTAIFASDTKNWKINIDQAVDSL